MCNFRRMTCLCALTLSLVGIILNTGCGKVLMVDATANSRNDIYVNGENIKGTDVTTNTVKPPMEIPDYTTTKKPETPAVTTPSQTNPSETTGEKPAQSTATENPTQTRPAPNTTTETIGQVPMPQTTTTTTKPAELPPVTAGASAYSALNHSEVKGVWITYFELYNVLTEKSSEEFRRGIGEYYDNALSLGLNTVYVHVRPFGDAIYESFLYPWSKYCTGYIGTDPGYDPLPIMIEEAHKRGLSFQAWINPLRCCYATDMSSIDDSYLIKQWYNEGSQKIRKVNNYYWLNPAYEDVRQLIANGVAEIVSNYDVDGVHIDDYFYPTTESWFDSNAFANSGYSSLSQFRLDNCSQMVTAMYDAVKSSNKTALFGISTQGNIDNNETQLYADVRKWCSEEGYCDYMAPQIYYGFNNSGQPYDTVLDQWDTMLYGTGKELIPGLAVYKIGTEDTWAGSGRYEWINDSLIIRRQIESAETTDCYGGIILYSYQFIFSPESNVSSAVNAEITAVKNLLNN